MSDDEATAWPSDIIAAEQHGVRVFWIATDAMQELVDPLAIILGEHMADHDELHVTYNGMLGGWQQHAGHNASLFRSVGPKDRGHSSSSNTARSWFCEAARPSTSSSLPSPGAMARALLLGVVSRLRAAREISHRNSRFPRSKRCAAETA